MISGSIARHKPPRKRRPGARRGPWRSEQYRRWIAARPCLICGKEPTQAAHTENNGLSSKGSDASYVPLCPHCHDVYDSRVPITPEMALGMEQMDWAGIAAALYHLWKHETGRESLA